MQNKFSQDAYLANICITISPAWAPTLNGACGSVSSGGTSAHCTTNLSSLAGPGFKNKLDNKYIDETYQANDFQRSTGARFDKSKNWLYAVFVVIRRLDLKTREMEWIWIDDWSELTLKAKREAPGLVSWWVELPPVAGTVQAKAEKKMINQDL